jgi:hypothetical protein
MFSYKDRYFNYLWIKAGTLGFAHKRPFAANRPSLFVQAGFLHIKGASPATMTSVAPCGIVQSMTSPFYSPENAYIFRITHRDNIPWIVENGLHCRNSNVCDPNFVAIGNAELIDKRRTQIVEHPPGGYLSDYIPFYFTPHSVMMYQIKTGHNGIRQRTNDEIAILVSSLHKLRKKHIPFLYTDRHASLRARQYFADLDKLEKLDWEIWRKRDFRIDPEDMEKKDRYQAEALIHRHLPIDACLGVVCYSDDATKALKKRLGDAGEGVKVVTKRDWYF